MKFCADYFKLRGKLRGLEKITESFARAGHSFQSGSVSGYLAMVSLRTAQFTMLIIALQ